VSGEAQDAKVGLSRKARLLLWDFSRGSLAYDLAGDPEPVRARFPAGTERITVWPFLADAPMGWDPELDEEHVAAQWAEQDAAIALLRYPEPREAIRRAASS